jgi:uncharacterized protein YecE (DUF72 family)
MKPEGMLGFYSARLPTVEINNTFYRMPKTEMLAHWAAITPATFRFAIKASRRITHFAHIKPESADSVAFLYRALGTLGDKRGPVLFQLPPVLKKDVPRLAAFLKLLPPEHQAGAALCLSEREDNAPSPLVETAPWGYVRLRLETYTDAELEQWARRLAQTQWAEVYAFFMHEPTAPAYARTLMRFVA